jgi:hypothetical protein
MSASEPPFVPGLELARRFHAEAVGPILARRFPRLRHAAALLGTGSDVLGLDTPRSTDHHWGPRLQILVDADEAGVAPDVSRALAEELPPDIGGFPTGFGPPDALGVRLPRRSHDGGPIDHMVEIGTTRDFLVRILGFDPRGEVRVGQWLATPGQAFLELTAGAVFRDDLGELTRVRERLAAYPHDVRLLLMAAWWRRIGQLEPFIGRCGELGDDVGSRLVAASLVRDLMALGFLQAGRYAPYPKWFGTAWASLPGAAGVRPSLDAALAAGDWQAREHHVVSAASLVAVRHNELGLTPAVDPSPRPFYGRPFQVLDAGRFATALREAIHDPALATMAHDLGGIDAVTDNVDLLTDPDRRLRLADVLT